MKENYPAKKLSDIVMFDESSNVQLVGRLLKVHNPKLTVMCGCSSIDHKVLLFFNDCFKYTHCTSNYFFPQDDL